MLLGAGFYPLVGGAAVGQSFNLRLANGVLFVSTRLVSRDVGSQLQFLPQRTAVISRLRPGGRWSHMHVSKLDHRF